MLVETLLGWVQWLKGDKILRKHVKASSGSTNIWCTFTKGDQGHGFPQISPYCPPNPWHFNHGIPRWLDTGSNEVRAQSRQDSTRTQKCLDTFDSQTLERLLETHTCAGIGNGGTAIVELSCRIRTCRRTRTRHYGLPPEGTFKSAVDEGAGRTSSIASQMSTRMQLVCWDGLC
jgi:hypothetical protein